MHHRSRTRGARTAPAVLTALVLALAGCGADTADGSGPAATTTEAPARSADPTPVVVPGTVLGLDVRATVGPVAVDGDLAVLRVEIEATGGDASVMVGPVFANRALTQEDALDGARLVDLDAGVVREPARTGAGAALATLGEQYMLETGRDPVVGYVAFDAPGTATTAVLVPAVGLVEDVPVVSVADAGDLTVPLDELAPTGTAGVVAPTAFLETFSTSAGDAVRTRDGHDLVSVAVDSDVLFAVGSADLGPGADEALGAVVAQLALAADGDLAVVGHTDDVGEDAANQELSERRAQAVADRLGQIADLGRFDVSVEGRGETVPVSTETGDAGRALNRRVTVEFRPSQEPAVALPPDASGTPAAEGPTVDGLGSATLDHLDGLGATQRLVVSLVEVRRAGGYLVGTLDVRNVGTEYATFVSVLGSVRDGRGDLSAGMLGANNVTLLDGGVRVYPVDYLVDTDVYTDRQRSTLADLQLGSLQPGATARATVLWPDTGARSVVVDVPDGSTQTTDGSTPVRFVDVPVQG